MENVKFALPQWAIDAAVEGLKDLAQRLEIEAAALARKNTPDSSSLAAERLEQAREARKGLEFYIHL